MQLVPITTEVVNSNLDQGEVYRCTTLCDKVCQRLATGLWFSPGIPVSSINKTAHHYITEILLKVALNTIKPKPNHLFSMRTKCLNLSMFIESKVIPYLGNCICTPCYEVAMLIMFFDLSVSLSPNKSIHVLLDLLIYFTEVYCYHCNMQIKFD